MNTKKAIHIQFKRHTIICGSFCVWFCLSVPDEGLLRSPFSSVTVWRRSRGRDISSNYAFSGDPVVYLLLESISGTLSRRWTALQGWTGKSFKAFSLSVHLAGWNSSQQKQILPSPKSTLRGRGRTIILLLRKKYTGYTTDCQSYRMRYGRVQRQAVSVSG